MQSLDESAWGFPPPSQWPIDDEVVAVGADLAPSTVLYAYAHGMFPMYVGKQQRTLGWFSPLHRGIIPLDGTVISRSTRKSARSMTCTLNTSFEAVMHGCATSHEKQGNWINQDFIDAYCTLHSMGWAHSIEVWSNEDHSLIGGIYGIRIGHFFAGESMFHRKTDASKVAIAYLVELLALDGVTLFDIQWLTEHLASLGGIEIPRSEYLTRLESAVGIAILEP